MASPFDLKSFRQQHLLIELYVRLQSMNQRKIHPTEYKL